MGGVSTIATTATLLYKHDLLDGEKDRRESQTGPLLVQPLDDGENQPLVVRWWCFGYTKAEAVTTNRR
jgi:hypothetical protein